MRVSLGIVGACPARITCRVTRILNKNQHNKVLHSDTATLAAGSSTVYLPYSKLSLSTAKLYASLTAKLCEIARTLNFHNSNVSIAQMKF